LYLYFYLYLYFNVNSTYLLKGDCQKVTLIFAECGTYLVTKTSILFMIVIDFSPIIFKVATTK
jgi:hypothetical protein